MQAGQVRTPQGTVCDLFLIESAAVDVVREGSISEREHVVDTRTAGDFMGGSASSLPKVYVTARAPLAGPGRPARPRAFRGTGRAGRHRGRAHRGLQAAMPYYADSAGSALEIVGQSDTAGHRVLRTDAAWAAPSPSSFDAALGGWPVAHGRLRPRRRGPARRCPVRSSPGQGDAPGRGPGRRAHLRAVGPRRRPRRRRRGAGWARPRPCTARRRVWSPCCSMPRVPAARLRPRRASRTTWGSPAGSAVTT